jgi:hypothetical protein
MLPVTKNFQITKQDQEQFDWMYKVMLLEENMKKMVQRFAKHKENLAMEAEMRGISGEEFGLRSDNTTAKLCHGMKNQTIGEIGKSQDVPKGPKSSTK